MKKKIALMVTSLVLVVAMAVGGTLAYLIDTNNEVTNTFTVGNVAITLDEANVNEYGEVIAGADRVYENEYKLMPGHTYVKDPTFHVSEDSEDVWVFAKVDNTISDITTLNINATVTEWTLVDEENNVYGYNWTLKAGDSATLFTEFKVSDVSAINVDDDDHIKVFGYAIQADGFGNVWNAWTALNNQMNPAPEGGN